MKLLSHLFNYVLLTISKYNIDESHGLSHAMNSLTYANEIFEKEVIEKPYIQDHEKIIYISSILHDMCDKKYMSQKDGIKDISKFISSFDNSTLTSDEVNVVENIIGTMSYSYVKKNGFPDHGKYQTAYNIVREADLLCAYDFDRCMMYNLFTENDSNLENAFSEANKLFNVRMFKHYDDGLFTTNYALNNYKHLEIGAKNRITHWQRLLKKF
tara:strand:- start:1004 stop:1642 length:639 start_codon:yes stop_codon:yes gene_type:complete